MRKKASKCYPENIVPCQFGADRDMNYRLDLIFLARASNLSASSFFPNEIDLRVYFKPEPLIDLYHISPGNQ
jgi:hypothetical protein